MSKIKSLTQEQIAAQKDYIRRGMEIGLSTEPINEAKATKAIELCYEIAGLKKPKVVFTGGPTSAVKKYLEITKVKNKWPMWCYGQHDINWLMFYRYFQKECGLELDLINGLYAAAEECGWFIPLDGLCIVAARPLELHMEMTIDEIIERGEACPLHADGKPAILYPDGTEVWMINGLRITNKRYHCHSSEWKAEWLLDEDNAEMRRCIIEMIGYERIVEELDAERLDSWREYELLKITKDIDVEPIVLVKMTCPSTGMIHANRVPPDITSARDGIKWCNWGIDPAEFAVEA